MVEQRVDSKEGSPISVKELVRSFQTPDGGTLDVLKDLTFEVDRGALVSLVGPSGCGKSTLLNLIAGIDACTSGEIRIDAQRVGEESNARALGFVFQQPLLLNWRTVRRNVGLSLEETSLSKQEREARVKYYIELTGLGGYEDFYPHQISGGMQHRAALARALAIDPVILLMDEPFSGLDAMTAQRMREELLRIWQETGKTILFVTHDISEAVFLSQRVLIMSPKPAHIFATVPIEAPYPRQLGDDHLFEKDKEIRRRFFSMESALGAQEKPSG